MEQRSCFGNRRLYRIGGMFREVLGELTDQLRCKHLMKMLAQFAQRAWIGHDHELPDLAGQCLAV